MKNYKGTIIEESLSDNRALNDFEIIRVHISGQENPAERWHLYTVNVNEDDILKLSNYIKEEWYMHFWKDRTVVAVFKGKSFIFNYDDKSTWKSVIEYGLSVGIPKYQLDFPID